VVERAGVRVECHNLDYGPGGLLAFQHAAVYRELGSAAATLPTLEEVRQALRHLDTPALVARGPLAPPTGTIDERAARCARASSRQWTTSSASRSRIARCARRSCVPTWIRRPAASRQRPSWTSAARRTCDGCGGRRARRRAHRDRAQAQGRLTARTAPA